MTPRPASTFWKHGKRPARKASSAAQKRTRQLLLEQLEDRRVMAISLAGQTEWTEQGPVFIQRLGKSEGGVEGTNAQLGVHATNSAFISAIQSLAADPTNAKTVYVGTVNGGVWRTTDIDRTTENLAGVSVDHIVIGSQNPTVNAKQRLTVTSGGAGTFKLRFGGVETTSMRHDVETNQIKAALEALPSIGSGNLKVDLDDSRLNTDLSLDVQSKFRIEFRNQLAGRPIDLIEVSSHDLSELRLPAPHWEPLTDEMPSLAIGSVAVDPLDPRVVFAGTGGFSNNEIPAPAVGLIRIETRNNVVTSTIVGRETFAELPITTVIPTRTVENGKTVWLIGTLSDSIRGGVYRLSYDLQGKPVIRQLSGAKLPSGGSNGLDSGSVTNIKIAAGSPDLYFAAVIGTGIYRSSDQGVTWQRINSGLANVDNTVNIELSVSPHVHNRG